MILQKELIEIEEVLEKTSSEGMAVPKKRRSKAKGKTRLSNWKKKGVVAAKKAYSEAKTFFAKEKKIETATTEEVKKAEE